MMDQGRRAVFSNISIEDGAIEFSCNWRNSQGEDINEDIHFHLSEPHRPDNDLVAATIATLCGRSFQFVDIDLPVSREAHDALRMFTGASVTSPVEKNSYTSVGSTHVLNFSGGFDSLSALCLMPERTKLVSMDFGKQFAREREYFETYKPLIVSTNVGHSQLRRNFWGFMGAGTLLSADLFGTASQSFGSIFEAGAKNLSPSSTRKLNIEPFSKFGIQTQQYVSGLTEIGTIMLLARYMPEEMPASLASLARPGGEKIYRKWALSKIVESRTGQPLNLPDIAPPEKPTHKWGKSFAVDFLAFYIAKHLGPDVVKATLEGFPDEALTLSRTLSLSFYERINPRLYVHFPEALKSTIFAKCAEAGVAEYDATDWAEFDAVREILSEHHKGVL